MPSNSEPFGAQMIHGSLSSGLINTNLPLKMVEHKEQSGVVKAADVQRKMVKDLQKALRSAAQDHFKRLQENRTSLWKL